MPHDANPMVPAATAPTPNFSLESVPFTKGPHLSFLSFVITPFHLNKASSTPQTVDFHELVCSFLSHYAPFHSLARMPLPCEATAAVTMSSLTEGAVPHPFHLPITWALNTCWSRDLLVSQVTQYWDETVSRRYRGFPPLMFMHPALGWEGIHWD